MVVTKGKGNTCHCGGFSCIFSQITGTGLRNHSPDEDDFFSQSLCQVYTVRFSILFECWATPVRVFPIQKRYSCTLRAVFSLTFFPKYNRIEAIPSALRFHEQWCNPQAPDRGWSQAPEKKILIGNHVVQWLNFTIQFSCTMAKLSFFCALSTLTWCLCLL